MLMLHGDGSCCPDDHCPHSHPPYSRHASGLHPFLSPAPPRAYLDGCRCGPVTASGRIGVADLDDDSAVVDQGGNARVLEERRLPACGLERRREGTVRSGCRRESRSGRRQSARDTGSSCPAQHTPPRVFSSGPNAPPASHLNSTLGPCASAGRSLANPPSRSNTWSMGHLKGTLKLLPGMTPGRRGAGSNVEAGGD